MTDADDGYALLDWDQAAADRRAPRCDAPSPAAGEPATRVLAARPLKPFSERPVLPRRPFLAGTFSFPFSPGARLCVLLLAALDMACAWFWYEALQLGAVPSPGTWFGCAAFVVMTVMLAVSWSALASACALALVRDTANGCDEIQNWPGLAVIDWIADPLYVFVSLCASMLPGVALGWLLALLGLPGGAMAPLGAFFLFPIVFLSTLENDTPLGAVSLPVWHTLRIAGRGWATFYLATAVLLAAAVALSQAAAMAGGFPGTIVAGLILTVVWFTYFRLLGRLAWYCADRSAKAEDMTPEDDLAAGPEEEEDMDGILADIDRES